MGTSEQLAALSLDGFTPTRLISPETGEAMAAFLQYAASERLGIIPQGSRTKIHCGNTPARYDVVLSTSRLNRLLEHDHENLTVTTESGMKFADLQQLVAEKRQRIPLDPPAADRATIGGIVAANSCGPRRFLWKNPRDIVLGMEVAMPKGEVVKLGGKVVKNVAGYDLSKLFIGSCGTLGVILNITLKLLAFQESEQTIWGTVAGHATARIVVDKLLDSFLLPTAVVYLNAAASHHLRLPDSPILLVVYEGVTAAVTREIRETQALLADHGSQTIETVSDDQQKTLWRQVSDFAVPELSSEGVRAPSAVLKCSIPIVQTTDVIAHLELLAREGGADLQAIAHAGSGIVYFRLVPEQTDCESFSLQFITQAHAAIKQRNGFLVAEYVPLSVKAALDVWGETRDDFFLMERIKESLDPARIMSPGRWVGRL